MALSEVIVLNGIFSILVVIVFITVGVQLGLQYKKRSDKIYLLTGIAWIGISEPWWPSSIGFIIAIFNDTGLPLEIYLVLNNAFIPIFLTVWLYVMLDLMNFKKKTIIIVLHIIISLILEVLMFYFLINDISLVGKKINPVDVDFGPIAAIFLIYILIVFLYTGFLFSIKTLKINESEPKLRGKFLLIAFILFLIGALLELFISFPLNRIILLFSALFFYIGFVMPERVKRLFIKS